MDRSNETKNPAFYQLSKQQKININFKNITYLVPSEKGKNGSKEILKSVSGEFLSGELTAIMGSSGAGKSSLMNLLAGFERDESKVKGDVLINGMKRDLNKFRKISCYIMQMDELCPYLSVSEAMEFAADLKLGVKVTSEEKKQLISTLLETIGLAQVKHTRTSSLSGGQKKRLAIALELINNPPVMFFDEPTSGLDSSSCLQCVSLLKDLAKSGRTVICVIHQPSSSVFEMFDQLYFMAEGQCIYQGYSASLVSFLCFNVGLTCPSHHNPADFAIEVAVGKYGNVVGKLVEANNKFRLDSSAGVEHEENVTDTEYQATDQGECRAKRTEQVPSANEGTTVTLINMAKLDDEHADDAVMTVGGTTFRQQFSVLYKRARICMMRDMTLTHTRIVVHVLLGLLVGLLYFGIGNEASKVFSNVSLLFFNHLVIIFTATMATVLTFPLEVPVLIREHLNNWYSLKAYFLAKSAVDLPVEVLYPVLYMSIVYFMTDQPFEAVRFFACCTAGLMSSFIAQSIGLAIGIAFKIEVGLFMGPVSMAFPILLCGFLVSLSTVPVYLRWMCYSVYLKYAFHATVSSVYGYDRVKLNCSEPYCIYKSPAVILEDFDIENSAFWIDMLILVAYFLAARASAYIFFARRIRSRH